MNDILLLLHNKKSKVVDQLRQVLGDYFGHQHIKVNTTVPANINNQTIVVALLSDGRQTEKTGLTIDDMVQLEESGLRVAFEQDVVVIPLLLDGAKMPQLESLPAPLRKLGLSHALPLRTGNELPRDLGRVVKDLEEHLGFHPDNAYPWDLWLFPIGVFGTILCFPFLVLWLLDVWYWSYGYETLDRFLSARWILELLGPILLGCSLFLWAFAFQLRQHRLYLLRRTEFFRSGSGKLPRKMNVTLSIASVLAVASLGFGVWSAVPAAILAVASLLPWSWQPRPSKQTWAAVVIALCLSSGSMVWATWRTQLLDQFESCLDAYERGMDNLHAGNLETATKLFDEAIEIMPWFGHSYQGLATLAAMRGEWEEAANELTRAIECYPTKARGVLDPDREKASKAYENRAKLRRYLGQDELADADEKQAGEIDTWLDLFGGIFRFW